MPQQQYELIAPCHFGMESVVKNEIYDIGYEISEVTDGRVTFIGDAEAIARAKALVDEEGDGRYLFKNLSEETLSAH